MTKTVYISITDGHVNNRQTLKRAIEELPTGGYEFTFKRRVKRSNQQNKYWWKVVVPLVREGLVHMGYGEIKDNDLCHEVLKSLFLKTKISNGLEELEITRGTSELSKIEFMELIDTVAKWCSEYLGFALPMPNEQTKIFEI